MKKVTCLLAALLLACGLSWAQQITWTAADQGYENGQVIESVDFNDYVAGEFFKGSNNNAPKYFTTGAAIRCYGGNYFTITSDYVLTEIVFGFGSGDGSNAITSDVGTYENGTWTGSANEVTFTIGGTSGHRKFATFTITYDEGGSPAPSITASNVEIAYDATSGAIEYSISNPVDGGELTAATEAEWLTIGEIGEAVPFTCSVNDNGEREATVTLTYTYDIDQTVTKNVTVTQTTNPNAPGSEANPYTVAQARAAIDAGVGTQSVYATGIVSAIPTAYNSTYGNITFNMVDEEGDEVFLQAYRCGGDEAANVAVGDVAVVYGNLTKYGSTYEFGQGCQIVTLTHPVVTDPIITVTPAMVEVDAEEHEGTLALAYENLEISNMTDFDIQYYDAEGEETETPDWIEVLVAEQDPEIGEGCVVSYYMFENEGEARSVYFKVFATGDEDFVYSNLVTINQAEYVAPVLDYATLPFEFNGGRSDIEGTDGLTAEGLGTDYNANTNPTTKLKFDGTGDWMILHFNEAPGTLTFDIKGNGFSGGTFTVQTSEDGETYEDLAAYTELGNADTKTFADLDENVRYIKWIYTEKASGNVGLGDIHLYEFGGGPAPVPSITFDPDVVDLEAATQTIQIPFTYENIVVTNFESFTVHHYDAEGEEIQLPETPWYISGVTGTNDDEYNLTVFVSANEGEARSAYMKVSALDAAGNTVYSNLVTINQEAPAVPPTPGEWVMVGLNDLTEDDVFVIVGVYDEDESSFAMPNNGTNAPSAVDVTMVGNTLAGDIAENLKWNLSIGEDGYTFYPNGETESWLYCNNTNNGVRVGTNENNVFTMTPEGYLYNNATSRYIGIYNRQDWRCYTSINNNIKNQTFAFYKRVDEGSLVTYTLDIEGYGESDGGYYLIASPVSMIRPTFENGFITETYDLYYFDQAQNDLEWRNYKANHFNIAAGKGYLYASQENTTLTFTGLPYEGNGEVALDYVEGVNLTGWNLIGNPFDEDAYFAVRTGSEYAAKDFFVMNQDGDDFELAQRSVVHPMEGILVEADAANQIACFSTEIGVMDDPMTKLNIRVSNENGISDFARIRFGEGNNLEKFMLNPENTKIYFLVDGEDYAVVYADNMGEMPLNFSASADGTYTLNINPENMEMEYLHLIDNMTGDDVDLLANPSYSFNARVNDNINRFKLVFASLTGIEENNDNFAFFSNGNVIVSNEGNAMLQVVDMTGRIVKSENINGTTSVSVEAAPGVYMLRLVNGDNMKVQKIVVR